MKCVLKEGQIINKYLQRNYVKLFINKLLSLITNWELGIIETQQLGVVIGFCLAKGIKFID